MSSGAAEAPAREAPPLLAIAAISAAALAYEVLLTRLFSIVQWHHFAYMVISLALLGFGASGTFLAIAGRPLMRRFAASFTANAALFAVSAYGGFLLAQQVPFNALEILWDASQLGWLAVMYLVLMVPFFFAANCIALALACFQARIGPVYGTDLLGAGAGSLGIVLLLFAAPPLAALKGVAALGALAAALGWLGCRARPRWVAAIPVLLAVASLAPTGEGWRELEMSEYKQLRQTLRRAGARVAETRSSPLGFVTAVESREVPLRHAPGLSLKAQSGPPAQVGLFTDGDALTAVTRFDGPRNPAAHPPLGYLGAMTSALPYRLLERPEVLVLGAGGGMDVLQALYHGARRVGAVELNPQIVELVQREYREFSGGLYGRPDVSVHVAEARGFVAASARRYGLIQVALLDSFNASSAGLYALNESHLYTVEAITEYLRHLEPGGFLALTRWVKLPPRDGVKLFATAVAALERQGVSNPGDRLGWIRGWNTSTLLVKNGRWRSSEAATLRDFCEAFAFDPIHYPGMAPEEANRRNRLEEPYFHRAARALLGPQRARFLERYKFDVAPTYDDRPYFFNFFKWSTLPEILRLRERGGVGLFELGYLILATTLVQASLASVVLILLPLWVRRRALRAEVTGARRLNVFLYFLAVGLAFLFLEIAFIQKFVLFLSHPVYAVAVVLAGFLVFAGVGSQLSPWLVGRGRHALLVPILVIVALGLLYVFALPPVFDALMPAPTWAKILLSLALIAPLALCMGTPFPHGLSRLAGEGEPLIPWAWGINGCASVVSAVLGTILAIHLGFNLVVLAALGLYLLAWAIGPHTFPDTSAAGERRESAGSDALR